MILAMKLICWLLGVGMSIWGAEMLPRTVNFPSGDGKTELTGYLFEPEGKKGMRVPAVVMLHGRAGAYSSLAKGV